MKQDARTMVVFFFFFPKPLCFPQLVEFCYVLEQKWTGEQGTKASSVHFLKLCFDLNGPLVRWVSHFSQPPVQHLRYTILASKIEK